jgi:hypothetical protein
VTTGTEHNQVGVDTTASAMRALAESIAYLADTIRETTDWGPCDDDAAFPDGEPGDAPRSEGDSGVPSSGPTPGTSRALASVPLPMLDEQGCPSSTCCQQQEGTVGGRHHRPEPVVGVVR